MTDHGKLRTANHEPRTVNREPQLRSLLDRRILILDGAMGTMIQRYKLTEADFRGERFANHPRDLKGDSDVLVLTRPDVISAIHHENLAAGPDIIEKNTFGGTGIAQGDYGLEDAVYDINYEGARLARAAAAAWTEKTPDRPRFVAGSMGPTNRTLSISPDVNNAAFRATTFDEMRAAYETQVRALIDGGSDILLLETIFDTLVGKAALVAIDNVFEATGVRLPLMISVTVTDRSGRTLSGQTVDAFYVSIRHAKPFSVGINCALGARDMRPYLAELARLAECYVSAYPNAGLPNAFGEYDEQPEETATLLKDFATSGFVNMLGGCCGTTPEHIAAVAHAVEGVAPRPLPLRSYLTSGAGTTGETARADAGAARQEWHSQFAGLEVLTIRPESNFQMIGERTNVTGSARFARLIKSGNYTEAVG